MGSGDAEVREEAGRGVSVPVSDVTSLTQLAQTVLTVAEGCLATTTAGTPARSFYAPGAPPWDCCPALCVYVSRLSEEVTSPFSPPIATGHRTQFGRLNLVTLVVLATRCDTESLDAAEIEAVADMVQEDGWALWNGFYDAIRDGEFQDECSDIHFDLGQAVPASPTQRGGCVGWQFTFRAQLGGIPN